jgi:hypothetical protein
MSNELRSLDRDGAESARISPRRRCSSVTEYAKLCALANQVFPGGNYVRRKQMQKRDVFVSSD